MVSEKKSFEDLKKKILDEIQKNKALGNIFLVESLDEFSKASAECLKEPVQVFLNEALEEFPKESLVDYLEKKN